MYSSPTREHPQDVLEAEILSQPHVQYLHVQVYSHHAVNKLQPSVTALHLLSQPHEHGMEHT